MFLLVGSISLIATDPSRRQQTIAMKRSKADKIKRLSVIYLLRNDLRLFLFDFVISLGRMTRSMVWQIKWWVVVTKERIRAKNPKC